MASPDDVAPTIIDRIERAATPSVAVLRSHIYDALTACGVNVQRLVDDARSSVKAELEERATKAATRARLLRDRVRAGTLPPQKLEEARVALARAPATVKAAKAALKRLEARPAPPLPSAPTRELVRHMGREPVIQEREANGDPLSSPRHVFEWPVQAMAVAMTAEEYHAAERLRWAYSTRQNTPKAVNLNGAGGGVAGSRAPITDEQLRAGKEFHAIWYRLPPELRLIVTNFVFEEPQRGHDAPLSAIEFGKLYGNTRDPNRARGVTVGALRATLVQVGSLYREYDQWRSEQRSGGVQRVGLRRSRLTDDESKMLGNWNR